MHAQVSIERIQSLLGICLGMVEMDHMVVLFLAFGEKFTLISIVDVPIFTPTHSLTAEKGSCVLASTPARVAICFL